jgi:phytoene synthase
MNETIAASIRECRRVTARSGSTFRFGFGLLSREQADAMHALYAFCRLTDDIADGPEPVEEKRETLIGDWNSQLESCIRGEPGDGIFPALGWAIARFEIDFMPLIDVINGAYFDLDGKPIRTWGDLESYCHLVASSVGLACLDIWMPERNPDARPSARAAGVALQLTNILRDVAEDRDRGRVYFPDEAIAEHAAPPEKWAHDHPGFRSLMAETAGRARDAFAKSNELIPMLPPRPRILFRLFLNRYRLILDGIERSGYAVLNGRYRPGKWRTAGAIARAFAGW